MELRKVMRRTPETAKQLGKVTSVTRVPVAVRLPGPLVDQIDAMSARRGIDRSALLFEFIERGFLQVTLAEITSIALDRIDKARHEESAVVAILDDIADRLDVIEKAIKSRG